MGKFEQTKRAAIFAAYDKSGEIHEYILIYLDLVVKV